MNVLFMIAGFTLLGFGIFLNVSKKLDIALSPHLNTNILGANVLRDVGQILIVFAVFTILLSSFGCLGAVFKNRCFLYMYTVILTLLILAELAACIVVLSSHRAVRDSYYSGFREFFNEAQANNHTDQKQIFEEMQRRFECCGANNVTDYYKGGYPVPASCHRDDDIFQEIFDCGCAQAALDWLWNQFPVIGGVLGGVLLMEIFGVVSAVALAVAVSHTRYEKMYE